mmetsp:Transcript_7416/g.18265  ORF Transcript_7416/g.18265 Transcript_7416/m.18265 type:complete len:265 (+) Transcript_7416:63-857(+)
MWKIVLLFFRITVMLHCHEGSRSAKDMVESLVEIGPQVVDVFEADGHPEEVAADAGGFSLLVRDDAVREGRRRLNEGIHGAKGHGRGDEVKLLDDCRRRRRPAADAKGQDRPRAAHLPRHGALEVGEVDRADRRVRGQPARELDGVLLLRPHADGQRLQAPVEQVARQWVKHRAREHPHLAQLRRPSFVPASDHSAHDVAVAAEEFGGAVKHQSGAQCDRVLQHGRGEGRVDDQRHRDPHPLASHGHLLSHRGDVDQLERRVCG